MVEPRRHRQTKEETDMPTYRRRATSPLYPTEPIQASITNGRYGAWAVVALEGNEGRQWVDCGPTRFARPGDADELKAVIYCLKPRRPTLRPLSATAGSSKGGGISSMRNWLLGTPVPRPWKSCRTFAFWTSG
jgi:hypothetical protein